MPGWYRVAKPWVEAGKLAIVGVVQDQHPDRARLFMQWREMAFPVLVDALNTTGDRVVPLKYLLDENGIVRSEPRFALSTMASLVEAEYPGERVPPREPPSLESLRAKRESAADLRAYGDALFLRKGDLDGAIDAFAEAARRAPQDGASRFRLGVALRRRFDRTGRPGDFARAVRAWTDARRANPRQYVWMRRLQQYGPRLTKPYDFFGWVERARTEIAARGETPVALAVEPRGVELAEPARSLRPAPAAAHPDPDARLPAGDAAAVEIEVVPVAPMLATPGAGLALHVLARARAGHRLGESATAWLEMPAGWRADHRRVDRKRAGEPPHFTFEAAIPADAPSGRAALRILLVLTVDGTRARFDVPCAIEVEPRRRRDRPRRRPRRG